MNPPVLLVSALLLSSMAFAQEAPFAVEIVPESASKDQAYISIAADSKRPFYVLFSNLTDQSQDIFEAWNSWGYQVISFELTTPDGKISTITRKKQDFTRNFPSTFTIPPHGHQVFTIVLNDEWQGFPEFGGPDRLKGTLKAVYTLAETPESTEKSIWAGTVSSAAALVEILHW